MNAKIRRLLREEGGFTLSEMLVTIVIMLMVFFALHTIFDMSIRVFSFGNDKVEAVENARLGLEKIERELRAAYPYDKAGGNNTLFSSLSTRSVTFGNDLDGNRKIECPTASGACETITYRLSGSVPYSLLRTNSAAGAAEPVVDFVKPHGLSFRYLNKDGSETPTESAVTRVRIKLEVEIDRGNFGKRTQSLTTDVDLRNR